MPSEQSSSPGRDPQASFRTIGLIGRLGSTKVVDTLKRLIRFLDERGHHVIIEEKC